MTARPTFAQWLLSGADLDPYQYERLKLTAAFDLYVSRLEAARQRGADNPLTTISPRRAGGNSRACTRRMLSHLGYTAVELRVVHRLMAGSASGWRGLIRLYASGSALDPTQREYLRRQLQLVSARPGPSQSRGPRLSPGHLESRDPRQCCPVA